MVWNCRRSDLSNMWFSNIRTARRIIPSLDRRDPDYDDNPSIDDQIDDMADIAEERYRERKIENDELRNGV